MGRKCVGEVWGASGWLHCRVVGCFWHSLLALAAQHLHHTLLPLLTLNLVLGGVGRSCGASLLPRLHCCPASTAAPHTHCCPASTAAPPHTLLPRLHCCPTSTPSQARGLQPQRPPRLDRQLRLLPTWC